MVTHELTVFPDGRVDGCFSVRKGDYNSHALHFALADGLTAAAAKLLLWMADGSTPVEYDTRTNRGTSTGSDVQITPESWGPVGRARLQLVLLDSAGNEIWQCRQFAIPVEDGDPQETTPGTGRSQRGDRTAGRRAAGHDLLRAERESHWNKDRITDRRVCGYHGCGADHRGAERIDDLELEPCADLQSAGRLPCGGIGNPAICVSRCGGRLYKY